jgi:hypothetical protein
MDNFEEYNLNRDDGQSACRAYVENRMRNLMEASIYDGWLESEVALALADAAEDYVLNLAKRLRGSTPAPHLRLIK